jgi:hypothetical protein
MTEEPTTSFLGKERKQKAANPWNNGFVSKLESRPSCKPDDAGSNLFGKKVGNMESKERESRDVKQKEFLKNPVGDAPDHSS